MLRADVGIIFKTICDILTNFWNFITSFGSDNCEQMKAETQKAIKTELQKLETNNKYLEAKIQQFERNLAKKNKEIQELKKVVTERDQEIKKLQSIKIKNDCQISFKKGQVIGANANYQAQRQQKKQLEFKIAYLQEENQKKTAIADSTKKELQTYTAQLQQTNQRLLQQTQEIQRLQSRQEKYRDQINDYLEQKEELKQQIQMLNRSLQRSNDGAQKAYSQNRKLRSFLYTIKNQKLFQKSIFLDQQQRQELVIAVRIQAQDPLESTKSIYFSSTQNKTNTNALKLKQDHSYAFVAKTYNGKYLAAVSLHLSKKLLEALRQNRDFMIDLADKRNFFLKTGRSALFQIRDNQLIFGNNDLKVQINDFNISTNLGRQDSSFILPYWEKGIFGEPDPVFRIESFQVFELFLAKS